MNSNHCFEISDRRDPSRCKGCEEVEQKHLIEHTGHIWSCYVFSIYLFDFV